MRPLSSLLAIELVDALAEQRVRLIFYDEGLGHIKLPSSH